MTSLNDKLRLEILASTSGNVITNHSAQAGVTTGWTATTSAAFPFGDGPVTAASGLAFGYTGKALKSHADYSTFFGYAGSAGIISDPFPVAGLQWLNFAMTMTVPAGTYDRGLRLGVEWYNGASVRIGRTYWRYDANIAKGTEQTFTFADAGAGGFVSDGSGWNGSALLAAPSGTATAKIFVSWGGASGATPDPTGDLYIYKIMVVTGSTKSKVTGPVFSDVAETWQNLLPNSLSANVVRGGKVDGVTDNLDAGLMTARVKDPLVTPENNDRVRPGRPVRLMALSAGDWSPIFRGKLTKATTSYAGDVPIVTLTATDLLADLENFPQPIGKSGTFKQRFNSALVNVPNVPVVITDAATPGAQSIISGDESGTALKQLELIRDSLRGLFYPDREGTLRAFANASYPTQTPGVTLSDSYADTGAIYYTEIDTNFDSANCVNSLLVAKTALSEPSGTTTYGPYVNQASVDAWGPVSATLTVNDGTPATLAAAYLAVYDTPQIFAETVTFSAADDIGKAIVRELYEAVRVKFSKATLNAVYRVIGIEHSIVASSAGDSWHTTLRFKPLESTSTITVTNPPGGAGAGPKDLLPFTREIQTAVKSVAISSASSKSQAVSFPKGYEKPPNVFITQQTGGATSPRLIAYAGSITEDGFNILALSADGSSVTATRDWQWVAVPVP